MRMETGDINKTIEIYKYALSVIQVNFYFDVIDYTMQPKIGILFQ